MAPRPPYLPSEDDRKRVRRLAQTRLTHHEIAQFVIDRTTQRPISVDQLREHYQTELGFAPLELFASVADKYMLRLTGAPAQFDDQHNCIRAEILPSEAAQREFLKNFGRDYGWAGPTDDPFAGLDLTKLTDVELSTFKAIIAKCAIKPGIDRG